MENHNWDRLIWKIPYLFAYLIIIVEQELIGKMVIVYVIFFIWLIEMIAKQNRVKKERSLDRKSLGIATFILILLLSLIWINEVYFIVGLLSLLFLFYKVFEFIGDLVEKILMKKVEFPVLLISLIKLGIWTVGYYLFIHCFAYFLENYINIIGKSDDLIVKAIKIERV